MGIDAEHRQVVKRAGIARCWAGPRISALRGLKRHELDACFYQRRCVSRTIGSRSRCSSWGSCGVHRLAEFLAQWTQAGIAGHDWGSPAHKSPPSCMAPSLCFWPWFTCLPRLPSSSPARRKAPSALPARELRQRCADSAPQVLLEQQRRMVATAPFASDRQLSRKTRTAIANSTSRSPASLITLGA